MEVNIFDQEQYEKAIEVNVAYDELKPKFNDYYNKYKKTIQLEGFRKGKVPLDLIKKVFGTKIEREVAEDSVTAYLQDVIDEHKIKFHDLQKVESLDYNKNDGLTFKAIIRVEPDISLTKYKGLIVEKEIYKVTDDDINFSLENLRGQNATMNNIETEAKEGHYIVADLQKTDSAGHPLIGEKYENRYFQLGGDNVERNIINQLLGTKPGDKKQLTVPAPENEEDKNEYYSVSVKEVKEKNLPELDDEFAKDLGDYENLDSLKDTIRENIEKQSQAGDEQKFHNKLMDQLIKNNLIDLPDFMIEDFLNAFIKNMKAEDKKDVAENEIKEKYRSDAIWNLKWMLIRDKISELEDITVEDADVEKYIEELVKNAGKDAVKVRNAYKNKKQLERLKRELNDQKIMNFLTDNSKITEKIVTYQDLKKTGELIQQ